jgi:integrase
MKINVRLSSKGESRSIIFRISIATYEISGSEKKYKQLDYSTGLSVKLKDWNATKRRTKNDSYKNGQIARGLVRVEEIGSKLASENNLSLISLKNSLKSDEKLNEIFNREREIITETDYIAPMEFIRTYIDKAQVTAGTKKDYNNTYNHLIEFQEYTGKNLSWKSMGYEFYLDMVEFLKVEKDLKGSTIDKVIKNVKVFLSFADLQDNLNVNQDFKKTVSGKSLFAKVNKEETEHVYLNEKEIKQITEADMGDERLSEIRDLFLIGCWTGLRISDLKRLQSGNIKDGLLTITAQKTSKNVTIPITDELQAVLNKYPDRLPKIPTDQHYNRQLKEVCRIAKISEPMMAEIKKGKMRVTTQIPKYELITSHTARRSFATNLYRRGIPSTQLMMLTGHKSETSFLKYIKVSGEDNAKDVAKKLKKIG